MKNKDENILRLQVLEAALLIYDESYKSNHAMLYKYSQIVILTSPQ